MFEVAGSYIRLTRGDYAQLCLSAPDAPEGALAVLTARNKTGEKVIEKQVCLQDGQGVITFESSETAAIPAGTYGYDIRVRVQSAPPRWITPNPPSKLELMEAVGDVE